MSADSDNLSTYIKGGLPGQRLYADLYVRSTDPNDLNQREVYGGEQGEYKVVFTLNRPGFPLHPDNEVTNADKLRGDSHLAITAPAIVDPLLPDADRVKLAYELPEIGNIEFTGYPNEAGFLGKVELEFPTDNFKEAEDSAHYLLAPLLSFFSTYLDIPLSIYQVDITEKRTGNMRMSIVYPFQEAPLLIVPLNGVSNEWRGYASLYREALNSNSPAYQFLCLFKIIDGIGERHKRLGAEARKRGEAFNRPPIVVPENNEEQIKWLKEIFPMPKEWNPLALNSVFVKDALGRRLSSILETHLRPLRNDIAHTLFSNLGELTVSIDEAFHILKVHKWLPLMKCLVRWMLKNEFPQEFSFSPARQIEIE